MATQQTQGGFMKSSDVVRALAPDDQTAEDEPVTNLLYPLRFLGMGLLIAWLCCTHVLSVFPGNGFDLELRNTFDYGMRFGDIGTFLLLALLATRIGRLSDHTKLNAVLVSLTTCGTALVGLVLIPSNAPNELIAIVSAATAIGGAVLFCLWAEAYSQMGTTRTLMYGAFSCMTAAGVSFIIGIMQQPWAIIATSLLPLASLGCAMLSYRVLPREPSRAANIHYPLPWKLIAIMTVAGLISGLAGSMLPNAEGTGAIHRIVATGLAGAAIVAMTLIRKNHVDVRFLAKTALPLSLIALGLIPLAGSFWGYAISFLLKLAYVWFTFFVLLMLASISYRFEVPSLRLFAIARASSELALFVGVASRKTLQGTSLLVDQAFLIGLALGGIVLVLVCALIWASEKSVNGDWGASGISISNKLHVESPRERFMTRCDTIAERHELTARETEIMALIAQRKSRTEIEQELFLSQNTVKTHVRHLYAKLGTRSKADVIALFED